MKLTLSDAMEDFRRICLEEDLDIYLDCVQVTERFPCHWLRFLNDLKEDGYKIIDDTGE